MARRLLASVCAVVLAACPKLCFAEGEQQRGPAVQIDRQAATAAERWSIRAFLRRSERGTHDRLSRPPPARPHSSHWYRASYAEYSDHSSPLSRLRSLRNWRLATLWRGRDSSLVLGLVDDAYFGFRLDAEDPATSEQ